jgi:Flp pilus assembly protein TadG
MRRFVTSRGLLKQNDPLFPHIFSGLRRALRQEGQALVETALVVPIIITLVFGILIFGIFTMQIMSLTEGVSSAGRVLAVSAGQTLDPCALAATTLQKAAPVLSTSSLSYSVALTPQGGSTQTYPGASCSSTSTTTGAPGNLVSGGTVQITATYSNCSLQFYGKNFLPRGCSITSTITETIQ